MAHNFIYTQPGIGFRYTEEELLRIRQIYNFDLDRIIYKTEIFSYVFGDVEIPEDFMNDDMNIRMKYLQSC